jgi:hypothetical protein
MATVEIKNTDADGGKATWAVATTSDADFIGDRGPREIEFGGYCVGNAEPGETDKVDVSGGRDSIDWIRVSGGDVTITLGE